MPASGGNEDVMEEVSDTEMPPAVHPPAHKRARSSGGDEMEEVPDAEMRSAVHPPARKRARLTGPGVSVCSKPRALRLLDLPVALLLEILRLVGNLQSADKDVCARNAAHGALIGAERRLGEALQFGATWTNETKEHYNQLWRRDICDARLTARRSFGEVVVTDAVWYAAMHAAEDKVRERARHLDPRCRTYFIEKLEEFVKYFFQIMTRNAGLDDFFERIRRLSKPSVDAFVSQLGDETAPKSCPQEFSHNGVWTIFGMLAFIIQNATVSLMKGRMLKELQKDVCECRKKYNACKRQVGFATAGFCEFLLLQQALAQRREDENIWRINRIEVIE